MINQPDLISIIIPIYNAEKSIEKSIRSIQKSTYTNLEIILVDDGSTDGTLELCNKLKNRGVFNAISTFHTFKINIFISCFNVIN